MVDGDANTTPSATAAELLGLLGVAGFEKRVGENVIVSRSRAAAVDTIRLFEVGSRTSGKTPRTSSDSSAMGRAYSLSGRS